MPEKTPRFRIAMKRTLGGVVLCWACSAGAAFVSPVDLPPERDSAAVFEKREVNAEVVKRAVWKVTGQGVFEAYVNGRRVGDDFLKPGFTESGKCRHVYSYDVTGLLDCAKGATNILSAVVAAGWWCDEMMTPVRETPWQLGKKIAFCGRLEIEYASGMQDVRETDPSWLAAYTGPVVTAGIYEGETYDARRKVEALKPVEINREFSGELRPAAGKVVLRRDLTLNPVDIYVTCGAEDVAPGAFGRAIVVRRAEEDGTVRLMPGELLVVDFGQNAAAVPSFEVSGDSGTTVTLRHAEMLNEANGEKSRGNDGPAGTPYLASLRKAKATLSYTLGDGKNDFMPRHTFFGYRYLAVTTTAPVRFSSFRSVPVSSVTQTMERGMIKTGNARVNRLIENIRWGVLSNYLSVPTDCPQRDERLGWTADTQVFMDSAAYLLDTYDFLSKYLADLRDAQFPDGLVQCFVPNVRHVFSHKASCGWTDACILIPYRLWKWYGRREIVDVSWPSMVKYMDFLDSLEEPYNPKHHGDWLSFEHTVKKKDGSDAEAPEPRQVQMLNAVFRVWTARLMKEMAEETGRGDEARRFSEVERRHLAVFAEKYLGADGCLKEEYRGQCNDLYMLKLGLCGNGAAVKATKRDLVDNIKAHGNRLQTGFLGTPLLLPVLTFEVGNPELAYTLLLQDKFPSWLYSVDQGATTVWERWNGYTKEKGFGPVVMNSFNHYAYGCVLEWLFAAAAGIRRAPGEVGWKHFVLAPLPDRRLGSVDASFVSPEGKISSSWRYTDDGGWTWSFSIPEGATAAVSLPGGVPRTYGPGSFTLTMAGATERSAVGEHDGHQDALPPLPAGLEKEPESSVKIVYEGFRPFIDVNGERFEPDWNLCGSRHEYELASIEKTRDLGFRFFRIGADTRVIETAPGEYDFSTLDQQARRVLNCAPDAKLLLHVRLQFPKWCEAHPEDCVGYATGPARAGRDERIEPLVRPSAAAPGIRRETEHFFTCLGEYLKDKPWRRRIVAVRPCWGIYTEWHCYGMYESPDVGPGMTAAFRRYKDGIYAHDDPPDVAERGGGAMLLDPVKKRKVLDFYACMAEQISDYLLFCARESKRILPGRLAGAYYGYVFATHPPEGANAMLEKVLAAPEIDFLSDPAPYTSGSRRAGGSYCHRTVPATYHRFGKLPIIEDDMRFHHVARFQRHEKGLVTAAPRESCMTMRRNYLNRLFDGSGIQLCDPMGSQQRRPNFHDEPSVLKGLSEAMAATRRVGSLPVDSGNGTVVVVSTEERFRRDGAAKRVDPRTIRIYTAPEWLYASGMTFDICTLQDFIASPKTYNRVVLLNVFGPTDAERIALKAKLRRPGVVALWLVAPGSVTESGFSDVAMSDLTGLPLSGAAASPHVVCKDAEAFPLNGAVKRLADGSTAAFLPIPPSGADEWRTALAALGEKPIAPRGTYVRRHANLVMLHVTDAGEYTLDLPQDLKARKSVELISGETFAAGSTLKITTDGCDTLLFRFD